jgi:type IV pilus assembly protein PilC
MTTFSYQARDASGKIVSGIQDALNEDNAVTSLMSRGLMVLSLQKKAAATRVRKKVWTVKETDLVLFTRQLSTMVEAGISLVQALTALYDQCDPKRQRALREVISDVTTRVQGGETFHESIAKHPRVFDRLFVSMVKAGEHGGLLAEILDRLAGFLEASARLRKKVKSAMTYPVIVISIAFLITTFLIVKVVPIFGEIFADFGAKLPAPTQFLIDLSEFMRNEWYFLIGGGARGLLRHPHVPALDRRQAALGQMEAQAPDLRSAHAQDLHVAFLAHLCAADSQRCADPRSARYRCRCIR